MIAMAVFEPRKMLCRAGLCALLGGFLAASDKPLEPVDLELVITTDVSFSVDDMEARMQRDGAVTAFRSPEVVQAIQAGTELRVQDDSCHGTWPRFRNGSPVIVAASRGSSIIKL